MYDLSSIELTDDWRVEDLDREFGDLLFQDKEEKRTNPKRASGEQRKGYNKKTIRKTH